MYNTKYAPNNLENSDTECNSSDEDIIGHITKQNQNKLSELDIFLKVDCAPALNDALNWWKVSWIIHKLL